MDNKQKVTLNICGTSYVVTTEDSAGYMQELGAKVDASIRNMMNSNERASLVTASVMTALMQADEAKKAVQSADNLRKQLKSFFDDSNRSRSETDNLRREIARLKQENEDLKHQLGLQ